MADARENGDTPRYVVVGGGSPTAEQVAALTVALTPVAVRDVEHTAEPSGWLRAALLEGVGHGPFASPAQLALRRP